MTEKTTRTQGLEKRLSDFYKEHYFNELKRKEELTGRVTLPLGVLSILIGSIVAAFREINKPDTLIEYLIVILLICAVLPACMVVVNLWKSYHNRYWVIDTPAEIMNYKNKLLNYYGDPGVEIEGAPMEEALLDVLAYIDQEYAKHADYNSRESDRRSFILMRANVYLAITLAVATLALVLQLTRLASLPEQPQRVKIVNIREITMATPTGSKPAGPTSGPGSVSNNNPPKHPIPQKPQPTGGRLIRGDVDPGQVR